MPTIRPTRSRPASPEPVPATPLLIVRAGRSLDLRIGAVDHQSGVAEIVTRCRSRQNPEQTSVGRWSPRMPGGPPGTHYYPVSVPIPAHAPTDVWELYQVTLTDGEGNVKNYVPGRDFEEILFHVLGRDDVDHTPPRLLGIRFGAA